LVFKFIFFNPFSGYFKKVCEKCPPKLWLFSASGLLCVMKTPDDEKKMNNSRSVNPENIITTVNTTNDGGDW